MAFQSLVKSYKSNQKLEIKHIFVEENGNEEIGNFLW